jgi:hypothetical protein
LNVVLVSLFPVLLIGGGCVQRTFTIDTDPQGALVYINDQEIGRTPIKRDFTWYGVYDMQIRKDGYQTLDQKVPLNAPWWQIIPFDFFAELWPGHLKDERHFNFSLKSATTEPVDPDAIFSRAFEMRGQLESSPYTQQPTTRTILPPATKPTTNPTSNPTSNPTTQRSPFGGVL